VKHDPAKNIKFTGKDIDEDGRLYYFGARYYDSILGRWITRDPYPNDWLKPLELNKYTYVTNNSINLTDFWGWKIVIVGNSKILEAVEQLRGTTLGNYIYETVDKAPWTYKITSGYAPAGGEFKPYWLVPGWVLLQRGGTIILDFIAIERDGVHPIYVLSHELGHALQNIAGWPLWEDIPNLIERQVEREFRKPAK
jgi:RHS repeat-associated protein